VYKQNHIRYAPVRIAIYVTSECLKNVTYRYIMPDNNNNNNNNKEQYYMRMYIFISVYLYILRTICRQETGRRQPANNMLYEYILKQNKYASFPFELFTIDRFSYLRDWGSSLTKVKI
jgi:hypothetical protein